MPELSSAHGAPGAKHLLQSEVEEGTCLTNCHNGGVGEGGNIQSSTSKFYRHPMNYANGVHDVTEVPMSMAKHVECADCHNPHRVNQQSAPLSAPPPPHISGRLAGVSGLVTSIRSCRKLLMNTRSASSVTVKILLLERSK